MNSKQDLLDELSVRHSFVVWDSWKFWNSMIHHYFDLLETFKSFLFISCQLNEKRHNEGEFFKNPFYEWRSVLWCISNPNFRIPLFRCSKEVKFYIWWNCNPLVKSDSRSGRQLQEKESGFICQFSNHNLLKLNQILLIDSILLTNSSNGERNRYLYSFWFLFGFYNFLALV